MFGLVVLAVPLSLLAVFLLATRRRTRLVAAEDHPGLARLDRTQVRARWMGLAAALVLALLSPALDEGGRCFFMLPTLMGIALVTSLAIAEVLGWRDARDVGIASLETRRPGQWLPRRMLLGLAGVVTLLAALLVWCWTQQNPRPDSQGIVGNEYLRTFPNGEATGGPFPGSHYSIPLAGAVLVLLLALAAGLLLVSRRPRNGADPVVVQVDDQARRRAATAMVAAGLAGVAGNLAVALLGAGSIGQYLWHGTLIALLCALAATAVACWASAVYLVPGSPSPVPGSTRRVTA